jgi:hypothetical protein
MLPKEERMACREHKSIHFMGQMLNVHVGIYVIGSDFDPKTRGRPPAASQYCYQYLCTALSNLYISKNVQVWEHALRTAASNAHLVARSA